MNLRHRPAAFLLAAIWATGCSRPSSGPPSSSGTGLDPSGHLLHAQPKLPTVRVWLGSEEMIAEVARQDVEIKTGMMFRTNMAENEAMLFVFGYPDGRNFYMRNCTVPLSAAYISPDGEILEIIQLQPHDEIGVQSKSSNVQFVLEVPQGWFQRHNIREGTTVRTERGSLINSFQQSQ